MSGIQEMVGHRDAAAIHIENAVARWADAVRNLGADDVVEAAYHAQIACANVVFAAHHAAEAERTVFAPLTPAAVDPAQGHSRWRLSR